jgi:hypothetical protein
MQGAVKINAIAGEIDRTKQLLMVRDQSAYLQDILEDCNSIEDIMSVVS